MNSEFKKNKFSTKWINYSFQSLVVLSSVYATSHENNKPDDLEKVLAQTHDELTQAFQETKVEFEQFK